MRQVARKAPIQPSSGYTSVEMLVVMLIMAIMFAIAIPYYSQWRQSTAYREAARQVMSILRQARSQAIATDAAQCVQFDTVNQQFGFNANNCVAITNWTVTDLRSQATLSMNPVSNITFMSSGMASSGTSTVFILDSSKKMRFYIQVNPTGRIQVQGPL